MSKLKNLIKENSFKVAVVGVLLLSVGATLWFFSNLEIQFRERLLDTPNLTQEEIWRYEGSLLWWRTNYVTTFYPATWVLITIGLVLSVCPISWAVVQHARAK